MIQQDHAQSHVTVFILLLPSRPVLNERVRTTFKPGLVRPGFLFFGGVVERFIATVLKTVGPQGSVGSNPTPSAISGR